MLITPMMGAVVPAMVSPISPVEEKSNSSYIAPRVNINGAIATMVTIIKTAIVKSLVFM